MVEAFKDPEPTEFFENDDIFVALRHCFVAYKIITRDDRQIFVEQLIKDLKHGYNSLYEDKESLESNQG